VHPATKAFFAVRGGNAHTVWDTTADENPLGRCLVIFHPYIFQGAYWYESGYFRDNEGNSVPHRPLIPP
jgi:hypothetical protein